MSKKSENSEQIQTTRSAASPNNPANWSAAKLVPNTSSEWVKTDSPESTVSAIVRALPASTPDPKSSSSLKTAAVTTSHETSKENTTNSTARTSTRMQTATEKEELATAVSSGTPTARTPKGEVGAGLKLSAESMELIKNDFVQRRKSEGGPIGADEMEVMTTVEAYRDHLYTRIQDCGRFLDQMVGCRYVAIGEARKALELIVSMGIITTEEVCLSPDCETLTNAAADDVVTIHSLSNVVRKILAGRRRR